MAAIVENVRAKLKRRVSHKDPEPNFDDEDAEYDSETNAFVNKEVDDTEKDGEKYPQGRPNSFLNRMISHGNKKTEDEIARESAAVKEREAAQRGTAPQSATSGSVATEGAATAPTTS